MMNVMTAQPQPTRIPNSPSLKLFSSSSSTKLSSWISSSIFWMTFFISFIDFIASFISLLLFFTNCSKALTSWSSSSLKRTDNFCCRSVNLNSKLVLASSNFSSLSADEPFFCNLSIFPDRMAWTSFSMKVGSLWLMNLSIPFLIIAEPVLSMDAGRLGKKELNLVNVVLA